MAAVSTGPYQDGVKLGGASRTADVARAVRTASSPGSYSSVPAMTTDAIVK